MAKNFTDFQEITGVYTAPTSVDGVTAGVTDTQASSGMYLVGYEIDEPHGERRYTIESVLLAASAYHVGLENVDNESKQYMFNNSNFTGSTSADSMIIRGDLTVEGENVVLNTTINSTSALSIESWSPSSDLITLEVNQRGPGAVARFLEDDNLVMDIASNGNVGIGVQASEDVTLTVLGDISARGDIHTSGAINGRYVQQDGAKLDNLQPWADVTALNLSDVEARMTWLAANAPEHAGITPEKGFDLLEDGSSYKKPPTVMTTNAPAIGDYSIEKIQSVEYQADKTGDHSADIIFNDIPDGPWTQDVHSTYVKVTSANHDRLTSLRGVESMLFAGDDGVDLNPSHIAGAYHAAYPDFWSSADEIEYRNIVLPQLSDIHTVLSTSSAEWNSADDRLDNRMDEWISTYNTVHTQSGYWYDTSTNYGLSGNLWNDAAYNWSLSGEEIFETVNIVFTKGPNWDSTYTTVTTASSNWHDTYTSVNTTSSSWDASVKNTPNLDLSPRELPAGEADLKKVNITESLTAQDEVRLGGEVFVLSAGEWKPGLTTEINVGGDVLVYVDGLLVDIRT
jgi:hypothetical protein